MKSCYLVIYWTKIKLGDIHCIHVKIRDTEVELPKKTVIWTFKSLHDIYRIQDTNVQ